MEYTDSGEKVLSFDSFRAILLDFSDCVEAKMYSKMEYMMWKKMNKSRPADSAVEISWTASVIRIVFEDESECHFFNTTEGFGQFIYEKYINRELHKSTYDTSNTTIDLKLAKDAFDISVAKADASRLNINNSLMKEKEKDMKGFSFDFGPINNNMIRMSMYGLAVKNKTGAYMSYNAKTDEIMDVDIFNFDGTNFLYKMPVAIKDIVIGDIVIHQNVPVFVVGISEDQKGLVVVDPVCGERKEIMLPRSPFGFNFATKVVNFLGNMLTDSANSDNPFGNMWMFMAMQEEGNMSAILPMMMMTQGSIDPTMAMLAMAMNQDNNKANIGSMLPFMWVMQNSKTGVTQS